jgi:putative phosphodiesterase I
MKKLLLGLMLCTSILSMAETYVKSYDLSTSLSWDKKIRTNEDIINNAIKEEYNRYKAKAISISIAGRFQDTAYILFEK